MPNNNPTASEPWYARYEKLVQWCTLGAVILGGVLHYLLVDHPAISDQQSTRQLTQQLIEESERNQNLLEEQLAETRANTEALAASVEEMQAQAALARAMLGQMQDPTQMASDALKLEQQRLDRVRAIDELVATLSPNLQIKYLPENSWSDRTVTFNFTATNAGRRAFRLTPPTVSVTATNHTDAWIYSARPDPGQLSVTSTCSGFMSPGETVRCLMEMQSSAPLDGLSAFSFTAVFEAKTDLPPGSETPKSVLQVYSPEYLEMRMPKTINFEGELSR